MRFVQSLQPSLFHATSCRKPKQILETKNKCSGAESGLCGCVLLRSRMT